MKDTEMKTVLFYAILICLLIVSAEALSLLTGKILPDLFDQRATVMSQMNPEELDKFYRTRAHPILGWDRYGPSSREEQNCLRQPILYHYDKNGARLTQTDITSPPVILTVGDSFTHGDEVANEESYPAQLEQQLRLKVVNHGVGGFGPVQALLQVEDKIKLYPTVKFVIMGVPYENFRRMMSRFRPSLYNDTGFVYGFQPFMKERKIHGLPRDGKRLSYAELLTEVEKAFDHDFWARPQLRFPYIGSLLRAVLSNNFYYRGGSRMMEKIGWPRHWVMLRSKPIQHNFLVIIDRFIRLSQQKRFTPILLLIPNNSGDITSGELIKEAVEHAFVDQIQVIDVGYDQIEWERYNLRNKSCHLSPYGQGQVARVLADALRDQDITLQVRQNF